MPPAEPSAASGRRPPSFEVMVRPVAAPPAGAIVVPAERRPRRENSNLIQITSPDTTSLWRGRLWSAVTFKIKIDGYFVRNAARGASSSSSSAAPYRLRPTIVHAETRTVYGPESEMINLEFGKNALVMDPSVATVTADPYNTIEAEFHQDLFEHGDSFSLVVESSREDDDEVIFGRSPTITVTNFSLAIEECFTTNEHVMRVGENDFAWYSKCGGDKAGLSVTLRLKDEKGRVVDNSDAPMALKTELVYADGSPTPEMPLSPLKERKRGDRKTSSPSRIPLYRPLVPDPILQPGQTSHPFSFRIEEVSFHHPGQAGFKLKVSPADPTKHFVHPGLLEENIVVLSKPKHDATKAKKRGGRTAKVADKKTASRPTKVRKVSIVDSSATGGAKDGPQMMVPTSALVDIIRSGGKCRFCKKAIGAKAFLNLEAHGDSCQLSAKVLATIEAVNPTKARSVEAKRQPDSIQCLRDRGNLDAVVPVHPGSFQAPAVEHVPPPLSRQVRPAMVAPVQVAPAPIGYARAFSSSSSDIDPMNCAVSNGYEDDGGISALDFPPFNISKYEKKYLTPVEEGGYNIKYLAPVELEEGWDCQACV